MSDAFPLPARPRIDEYVTLAWDLHRACVSGDPSAVRAWASRWLDASTHVRGAQGAEDHARRAAREAERVEQRWRALMKSNERGADCLLEDAQLFVAREHGFASWAIFVQHIEALVDGSSPVAAFEAAADAIVTGDAGIVQNLLHSRPELVRARSTREHRSTLLHYVSANGVEDFRQRTPANILEIAQMLLRAGADVNAESDAYGGGCTTLGLVATSVHPERAGVQMPLLELLLDHGAHMDLGSSTGAPQSLVFACVANGQPAAAKFLAGRGAPLNLEGAAALGMLDVVSGAFTGSGRPKPEVSAEQIATAFVYACGYGRTAVVDYLLGQGVDRRTHEVQAALNWAAYGAHVEIMRRLLDRGWPASGTPGLESTPVDVALRMWAHAADAEERERGYQAVDLLVRGGATFDPVALERDDRGRYTVEQVRADPGMTALLKGATRQ